MKGGGLFKLLLKGVNETRGKETSLMRPLSMLDTLLRREYRSVLSALSFSVRAGLQLGRVFGSQEERRS